MNKTERIIHQLFLMARDQKPVGRARVASALAHKGKVIAYGFNQYRTAWMQRKFKKHPEANHVHAEVDAIRNALKIYGPGIVAKSTLYVARAKIIDGVAVLGNARPCCGCESCINWHGISRVWYSTDSGEVELFA